MARKKKKSTSESEELISELKAIETVEVTEFEVEAAVDSDVEEAPTDAEPFDESQLLELAQSEGLIDAESSEEEFSDEDLEEIDLPQDEQERILSSMEAILFMSDKPISLARLRTIIGKEVKLSVYRKLMAKLRSEFDLAHRGVEVGEISQGFQLRTKPHMAQVLRKMVKTQPMKLSGTNMEVLTIVAYKQPLTKDEIDQIRGVDSGYVLRSLMEKRLLKIIGRSDLPGKPMLYGTSHEFLELFNLKDLSSLPPLHEIESMVAASEVGAEEKANVVMTEFHQVLDQSTQVLFDDSKIDDELEAIRNEIASVPTSTPFIDEQKANEKRAARLAELATQGLTLNENDEVVPIGTPETAENTEHAPSPELEAQAESAQWERHASIIADAIAESQQVDQTTAIAQEISEIQEPSEEVLVATSSSETPSEESSI